MTSAVVPRLTPRHAAILHSMLESPAEALPVVIIEAQVPLRSTELNSLLRRLCQSGLAQRERRRVPGPGRVDNPFFYWRTAAGTAALAQHPAPLPLPDEDGLMDTRDRRRGTVTFQETMQAFGLVNLAQLAALPLAERRLFELEWTANMKAACAAAGEPISDVQPTGNGLASWRRR